jgi:hypothetical protein
LGVSECTAVVRTTLWRNTLAHTTSDGPRAGVGMRLVTLAPGSAVDLRPRHHCLQLGASISLPRMAFQAFFPGSGLSVALPVMVACVHLEIGRKCQLAAGLSSPIDSSQ